MITVSEHISQWRSKEAKYTWELFSPYQGRKPFYKCNHKSKLVCRCKWFHFLVHPRVMSRKLKMKWIAQAQIFFEATLLICQWCSNLSGFRNDGMPPIERKVCALQRDHSSSIHLYQEVWVGQVQIARPSVHSHDPAYSLIYFNDCTDSASKLWQRFPDMGVIDTTIRGWTQVGPQPRAKQIYLLRIGWITRL